MYMASSGRQPSVAVGVARQGGTGVGASESVRGSVLALAGARRWSDSRRWRRAVSGSKLPVSGSTGSMDSDGRRDAGEADVVGRLAARGLHPEVDVRAGGALAQR